MPVARDLSPLARRVLFTLGALAVYRIGTHIPLPGLDLRLVQDIFPSRVTEFGGLTIFALGVFPYLTVSFWVLLLGAVWPRLGELNRRGGVGFDRVVRIVAIAVAALQAYGIAAGLEGAGGAGSVVAHAGLDFRLSTVLTLTGGTLFLMWLGDQITARGIGNGIALILFTGVVARLPVALGSLLELARSGALSALVTCLFLMLFAAVVLFIVLMQGAERRILVQYRPRLLRDRMFEGEGAYLRLKLNQAGILPPLLASPLLLLPQSIAGYGVASQNGWAGWLAARLGHGEPAQLLLYGSLILGLSFLYVAGISRPRKMAETLSNYGGFIPGYGEVGRAAEHLAGVLARLTLVGGLYLALICLLPDILVAYGSVPFYFGGTRLLVVICIAMDLQARLRAEWAEGAVQR